MKNKSFEIAKKDFISFLANSTPEEINEYIKENGKPCKPYEVMVFFDDRNNDKQ